MASLMSMNQAWNFSGEKPNEQLMRIWHFSSCINSFFKHACAAIQLERCLIFGRTFIYMYFHTSWLQTAKALARLHGCAGLPEPSLVAYVISTIISWAGSNSYETVILITQTHTRYIIQLLPLLEGNMKICSPEAGNIALTVEGEKIVMLSSHKANNCFIIPKNNNNKQFLQYAEILNTDQHYVFISFAVKLYL